MREKLPVYATLEEACTALGVEPRSLSRAGFMATNLINDRRGRGDGRIKLFSDGKGGLVTNWKTGLTALFFYDYKDRHNGRISRKEWERLEAERKACRVRKAGEEDERQEAVSVLATSILSASSPSNAHPYLKTKKVLGLPGAPAREISRTDVQALINAADIPHADGGPQRLGGGSRLLLVPVSDEFGKVWALQMIDEHGSKSFLKGGRFKGCVWRPDDVPAHSDAVTPVGLAEGVATAISVRALYGVPCLAGMCAGFLPEAALGISRAYPRATLWLCGDRDANGVGEMAARMAASIVPRSTLFVCPGSAGLSRDELAAFKAWTGRGNPKDYNDFLIARS